MEHSKKRSRIASLAIGALVGSVLSIGAATGPASAAETSEDSKVTTESVISRWDGGSGGGVTTMRSGIRW